MRWPGFRTGLRSRWIIPCEWMCRSPSKSCRIASQKLASSGRREGSSSASRNVRGQNSIWMYRYWLCSAWKWVSTEIT
jgi:hypothetical protein